MEFERIENQVKEFCNKCLEEAKNFYTYDEINHYRSVAYGAVQFACNYLFPAYNMDLDKWWENEMRKAFLDWMP